MKQILPLILITILSMMVNSCSEKEAVVGELTLQLDIRNLKDLGASEQYEGWIIVYGEPISIGTFKVDDSGIMSRKHFLVNAVNLETASDFILTIEPVPDNNPGPSGIKILGGKFTGISADLSVAYDAALGNNFMSASGKYILATPTTNTPDDELSGMWFLNLSSGTPGVGLNLPQLTTGWVYEGWAILDGKAVSSGTFTAVNMSDNSAIFSGTDDSGYAFPGEDFVMSAPTGFTFPTDLSGGTLVITIEPNPDNSVEPFLFKPLMADVPALASDHITYDFVNMVQLTFPVGIASKQ